MAKPLNVLFITADQWRAECLSALGHPTVRTPNLDALAREGVLFVNHFASERGPRWWVERALAPASRALGWHPDFAFDALLEPTDIGAARFTPMPPAGLFTLVSLSN